MTSKVLQMAADSITLEKLKSLLAPDKSKQTATTVIEEAVRPLGRKSKLGFTLTKKEIKSMPEKQRKIFACENRIIPYRFHKGCTKRITAETVLNIRMRKRLYPNMQKVCGETFNANERRSARILCRKGKAVSLRIIPRLSE